MELRAMVNEVHFRRLAAALMGTMLVLLAMWGSIAHVPQHARWSLGHARSNESQAEWARLLRGGIPVSLMSLDSGETVGMYSEQQSQSQPRRSERNEEQLVSTQARIEMTVARLGIERGKKRLPKRGVFAAVSGIGVVGMYAAIVGAMLGVWLDEVSEDADDADGYSYWDCGEGADNEAGWEREDHYAGMREVGGQLYSY